MHPAPCTTPLAVVVCPRQDETQLAEYHTPAAAGQCAPRENGTKLADNCWRTAPIYQSRRLAVDARKQQGRLVHRELASNERCRGTWKHGRPARVWRRAGGSMTGVDRPARPPMQSGTAPARSRRSTRSAIRYSDVQSETAHYSSWRRASLPAIANNKRSLCQMLYASRKTSPHAPVCNSASPMHHNKTCTVQET